MKLGLIGLPQVGKKTLFALLTGEQVSQVSSTGKEEIKMGVAHIRDERLERLNAMYNPKKKVPASIDLVLLPKFDKDAISSGEFLKSLEKCDALCHIVRAFSDEAVFHIDGSVDALRDIEKVFSEVILADLILVEKRLEKLDKELRVKTNPSQVKEKEILGKMKELLDQHRPLIDFPLNDEERKLMSTYQFLTRKPLIIVLNVDDDKLSDQNLIGQVVAKYKDFGIHAMQVSARIEAELSQLDQPEREEFLKDLNISESALNRLTRLCYETLGLISFFTVGEREVHAWTVRKNSSAPEAAGVIHSDMQRGFIRAEIMRCEDLLSLGSEAKVKEAGKSMLKGKDYIVEDGDIMLVRFNI